MQNKGAIQVLAILLAMVSLYQLSFTWVANSVRKDAEAIGGGDVVKTNRYLDSIANTKVYPLLGYTFREVQQKELNLGLDLKGGMNVTLEISVVDVVRALANYNTDPAFNKAIALAKEKQKNSQDDFVTLFGQAFKELNPNMNLSAFFMTPELREKVKPSSTDEQVLQVLKAETQAAIDNSFQILRTRIDRFGVTQPNIQRLETAGRILVELPGVKDPARVRNLLQGTAQLEFWETYQLPEIIGALSEANNIIAEQNKLKDGQAETLENDTNAIEAAKTDTTKKDTTLAQADTTKSLLAELGDTTKKSTDTTATADEQRKNNPLWTVIYPNLDQQGAPVASATVGFSHFKDTSKVNSYLALKQVKDVLPKDLKFFWSFKSIKGNDELFELKSIKVTTRDGRAPLDGSVITDARQEFGQTQATAEVSMNMNGEGARTWAQLTKANINRQIAIVLDNYVYSDPNVNDEIKGGRSSISGNFTVEEATDLANVLKSGKLPAPAHIVEEAVVGPSLGKESINAGLISFIIAFILILVYMLLYYNKAGLVANISLITNIFLIFGVLASLGAVLTLPGIAGIVLTLGMAVDANVIIYERIKEEMRDGKGLKLAISDGYSKAYSAIIDGNLTTLLTGVVLYLFGSGPIQGFATTLIIGILTTLFTAIFISRIVIEFMLSRNINVTFDNAITRNWFTKVNIDFIGMRKKLYVVSAVVILIGIVSLATRHLSMGVDFTGGRTYLVRFDAPVVTDNIRSLLAKELGATPDVKTFGSDNQVKITTKFMVDSEDLNADSIIVSKLYNALKGVYKAPVTHSDFSSDNASIGILSSQKIGPTIADDIKKDAVISIIVALLGIFLYIALRFRKWQWGLGGVVSLFHDTLIVISVYSIFYGFLPFNMEIDQAFIAALLTVIGYSINDSVIIFDRIREYMTLHSKREIEVNINGAINSTLGRTFNTSMTTIVTLLAMFIFGGEVVRGFTFAMLVGIGVGTYSSIFNATPVAYDFIKMGEKKAKKDALKK